MLFWLGPLVGFCSLVGVLWRIGKSVYKLIKTLNAWITKLDDNISHIAFTVDIIEQMVDHDKVNKALPEDSGE